MLNCRPATVRWHGRSTRYALRRSVGRAARNLSWADDGDDLRRLDGDGDDESTSMRRLRADDGMRVQGARVQEAQGPGSRRLRAGDGMAATRGDAADDAAPRAATHTATARTAGAADVPADVPGSRVQGPADVPGDVPGAQPPVPRKWTHAAVGMLRTPGTSGHPPKRPKLA